MAIPYSLVVRPANPGQPEKGNKTYAVAQNARVLDLNAMAEHMSMHNSKYNKGDVMAVLVQTAHCIREQLLLGNKVSLDDFGAFSVVIIGKGADNAKSYTPALIERVRVRWEPSQNFQDLLEQASFEYVGSREAQVEARKAERALLNEQASMQPDTDTDADLGV